MPLQAPIVVESERLIVRPVVEGDLQALLLVNGDDEVTRFLPYASWRSLADGHAWFERMSIMGARGESIQYVVIERASSLAIGTCLLFRYEESSARAELGYVLGRSYWGRGMMREALVAAHQLCLSARLGCGDWRRRSIRSTWPRNRLPAGIGIYPRRPIAAALGRQGCRPRHDHLWLAQRRMALAAMEALRHDVNGNSAGRLGPA